MDILVQEDSDVSLSEDSWSDCEELGNSYHLSRDEWEETDEEEEDEEEGDVFAYKEEMVGFGTGFIKEYGGGT